MGKKDAPVTMIEFSDYQCPFCRRFFDTTLPTFPLRSFGRPSTAPFDNTRRYARPQLATRSRRHLHRGRSQAIIYLNKYAINSYY
ncbi:MAG: thioredoxin domain-containing protein [Candidatus Methylomirabilales bacterium]